MKSNFSRKIINFVAQKKSLLQHINNSNFKFIAPFYHSVSNEKLLHISSLYPTKTIKQFKQDLELFLKYYEPITETDLINYLEQHNQLPNKKFFLSFDDGFKECATIIAPILKQYGVPATFFINTKFIDNKDLMFRNKQQLLFEVAENKEEFVKNYLAKQQPYLTTLQVKNLISDGFSIGCHSFSHPYFSKLNLAEQKTEIELNENYFKENNIITNSFSFPFTDFGVKDDFFKYLQTKFKITFACAGLKSDKQKNHFQRIAIEDFDFYNSENLLKFQFEKSKLLQLFGIDFTKR